MIADHVTPGTVMAQLIIPGFRALLRCFGLSPNREQRLLRVLGPSLPMQGSLGPSDPPGFLTSARLFLGQRRDGDSTSPREVPRGSLSALSRALPSACQARSWKASHLPGLLASCSPFNRFVLTPKILMAHLK